MSGSAPADHALATTRAPALETDRGRAPSRPGVTEPAEASTGQRSRTGTTAATEVARWAAVSLALPGVVLVMGGDSSRRERRLATDLLAAATGDWQARPASRRFEWPPDVSAVGVASDQAAGRRAFGAFLGKDLTDHGARLLVCVESLAAALPEHELPCLVIPELATLGRESSAKRDLWRRLLDARG